MSLSRSCVLVWGMGYVGAVTAACFAEQGAQVIGVETNPALVKAFQAGRCPLAEPQLAELIAANVETRRLCVTGDGAPPIANASVSLVCVGTPSAADGSCDFGALESVLGVIGAGLRRAARFHTVVIRSTVPPGSVRRRLIPLLEARSGKTAGVDFGVAVNPEFLREGSAVEDFLNPPYVIIGADDDRSGAAVAALYAGIAAPKRCVALETAEALKLVNNAFHSLKIAFANEVGRFCEPLDVDATALMQLVCDDVKLNISPAYLRPGFAFGGSCLPKDLRSLAHTARSHDVSLPLLSSVLPSNDAHIESARDKIRALGVTRIAVLGLAFKAGTDDLRESPTVELLRRLRHDRYEIRAFDPEIAPHCLSSANRAYLSSRLPGYETILCDNPLDTLRHSEAILLCQSRPLFTEIVERWRSKNGCGPVLDLTRPLPRPLATDGFTIHVN